MRRRTFIKTAGLDATALASGIHVPTAHSAIATAHSDAAILPMENASAPLPLPHFPSRFHAFIWCNWELVAAEGLAPLLISSALRVLGSTFVENFTQTLIKRGEASRLSRITTVWT